MTATKASPSRRVAIIVGSTRPTRLAPLIAAWVQRYLQEDSVLHYEVVDLVAVDLPFLDEPLMAALGTYEHEHTKEWSRLVQSYDAFVFVFPQYNWGYPAPLKNALDFLYHEWRDKPAALVSYGNHGGNKGAAQLRGVLQGLHLRTLEYGVELKVTRDDVDAAGQLLDLESTLAPFGDALRELNRQLTVAWDDRGATTPEERVD